VVDVPLRCMKRIFNNFGELLGLFELGLWFLTVLFGPFVWMYFLVKEAKFTGFGIVLISWLASAGFILYAIRRRRFHALTLGLCVAWLIAVVMAFGFRSVI
jgi:hypothetical protein